MMKYARKNMWFIIAVAVLVVLVVAYFVLRGKKKSAPSGGLQVPHVEIQNNPLKDKVPDTNPVGKTNPFKYQNPLR